MSRKVFPGCLLWVGLLLSLTQCDRSPPEPVATASARPREKRCTVPTPAEAPSAVPPGPDPRCPADPTHPPAVPISKLRFPEAPRAPVVQAETMLTEEHRNRGLMYRRELAEDRGMLFVFEDSQPRSFWMHNTCLPLDMLFVAEDGYITGILENVPTMNDDGRSIPCKAKFVVEVNAGFCRKHGIKAGQKLKIEGLALAAPRELLGNGGLAHPTPAARKGWGCAPGASRKRWACAAHARGKGADGAAPRAAPLHPPAPPTV